MLSLAMIEATYEDSGTENRNNKTVRKYRLNPNAASPGTTGVSSTFVWIDEQLGMPIRAEWVTNQEGVMRKTVNELRDISFNVEASLFEIPSDYRKIGRDEFYGRFRGH
jgi:outer membrane lipoprotein-sorting protein